MGRPKCNGGWGFRNLECFNLALLVKQYWRLMTQSNSLVACILKEKYFKGNLPSTSSKCKSSMLWKSLLATQELVDKGARWQVRNGKTIQIWKHWWLLIPNPLNYKPLSLLHSEMLLSMTSSKLVHGREVMSGIRSSLTPFL